MSLKRQATSELNHDNWDQENPADHEEMGSFKPAPEDVLEKRIIRTAKRRSNVNLSRGDEVKSNVFSNIGGFNNRQPSSFDFLANLTNGGKSNLNGSSSSKSEAAMSSSLFGIKSSSNIQDPNIANTAPTTQANTPFGVSPANTANVGSLFSASKSTSNPSPSTGQNLFNSPLTSTVSKTDTGVSQSQATTGLFGMPSTNSTTMNTGSLFNVSKSTGSSSIGLFKTPVNKDSSDEPTKTQNPVFGILTTSSVNSDSPFSAAKPITSTAGLFSLGKTVDVQKSNMTNTGSIFTAAKTGSPSSHAGSQSNIISNANTTAAPLFGIPSNKSSIFAPTEPKTGDQLFKVQKAPSSSSGFSQVNTASLDSTSCACTKTDNTNNIKYYAHLKALNESVSNWIKQHVEKTPACILTPIFNDYDRYLKEIQEECKQSHNDEKHNTYKIKSDFNKKVDVKPIDDNKTKQSMEFNLNQTTNTKPSTSLFANSNIATSTFKSNTDKLETVAPVKSSLSGEGSSFTSNAASSFSFGDKTKTTPPTTSSGGFSYGINKPATSTPFSFGTGKPFTFNSNIEKKQDENETEEDNEPPKVEYTPIVEDNSVYDKKCKIFVKKESNFIDKGVGTLYIKKVDDSGKHQLLVRANTSLGNVLVNLILVNAIPTQRTGKNNVMMVCIPTPDCKPPPIPILVRVKTSEEADELLETLNKYKS